MKTKNCTSIKEISTELKESEDEKIRKAIINYLVKMWGNCQDDVCGVNVEDAIGWLEKQSEQKTVWSEDDNKVYESINGYSLEQIGKYIEQDVETELSPELNIHICFDGNMKIYYKGDLAHCYMYSKMFRRHNDFDLEILSIEKYNEMKETIKKI